MLMPPDPPIAPAPPELPEKEELLKAEEARRKSYENFPLKSRFIREINKAISEGVLNANIEISKEEYEKYHDTIYSWFRELNYRYSVNLKENSFSKYNVDVSWSF